MGRNVENVIVGLFSLVFLYYAAQALLIGDIFRFFIVLIPSLVLSLLPFLFEYDEKVTLPAGTKACIALALLLHVAGGINRFYWKFAPYYDKLAHVVSALALVLLIFCVFLVIDHWETKYREGSFRSPGWGRLYKSLFGRLKIKHLSIKRVLVCVVLLTTIFMVGWEFAEYYIDVLVKSSYNNGLIDTMGDLIANIIGIGIALLIIRYHLMKIPSGKDIGWLLTRVDS